MIISHLSLQNSPLRWLAHFFEGAGGLSSCVCSEPIPLFDSSGQLQGYEVTATDYSDCPLGYVVFDVRCPGIVSRFSFAEGKPGPYEQIVGNDVSAYSLATDQPMLVSSSPLDFQAESVDALGRYACAVTYGSTQHQDIGPGFQRFCAERGVSILPVRVVSSSLQKFKNQVDALRQSVVMLAINEGTASAPKRAGHAMAVSGYGRITRGLTSLNCIVVHDGWSDEAFINYDFQGFMDKNGVFM